MFKSLNIVSDSDIDISRPINMQHISDIMESPSDKILEEFHINDSALNMGNLNWSSFVNLQIFSLCMPSKSQRMTQSLSNF